MSSIDPGTPDVDRIRNLAIVAHINAGKTTLTERILVVSGRQRSFGEVDSGLAAMDWRREEQERGISIHAAVTQVQWRGFRIQLVDTPGHVDFAAEVNSSLRVADAAIVVIDGVRGVEPQTEAVWRRLDEEGLPRLVFVNKLDRAVADLQASLRSIETRFRVRCVLLDVPRRDADGTLESCVDLLDERAGVGACASLPREELLALLGEHDPDLCAAYVEGRIPARDAVRAVLRRVTLARDVVPVLCGSALRDVGVGLLLDAVCQLLPSPRERSGAVKAALGTACGDRSASAVALVFSTSGPSGDGGVVDGGAPTVLARVFAGCIRRGDILEASPSGPVRILGLAEVHAAECEPVELAMPGEIVAVVLDHPVPAGATLRAPGNPIELQPARHPEPVLRASLEPEQSDERDALEAAAHALASADQVVRVASDPVGGELVVEVMGELQLDVFRERLERLHRRAFRLGEPRVLRRTVPTGVAEEEARVERVSDGGTSAAMARVRIEPMTDAGLHLRWALPEDEAARLPGSPEEMRREVLAVLDSVARSGLGSGAPLVDGALGVTGAHAIGSAAELVLQEAVREAAEHALRSSGIREQEPRVRLEVRLPRDALGAVLADLQARGAVVEEVGDEGDQAAIQASVRLARVLGWATVLRSRTRGMGSFVLWPDGWIDAQPA